MAWKWLEARVVCKKKKKTHAKARDASPQENVSVIAVHYKRKMSATHDGQMCLG